jgi:hypothetical protein
MTISMGECIDDPAIADGEILWRYIHQTQVTRDRTSGRLRPKSGAFIDNQRMSVDIASLTSIESARLRNPRKFTAQFTARLMRDMQKCVTQQLDRDPDNLAHAVVCPQLSPSQARRIANRQDIWADAPPDDFQVQGE